MIVYPPLPDLDPAQFAEEIQRDAAVGRLPVLVYGDGLPEADGTGGWRRLAQDFTVRHVHSPERLLDHASFFLHRSIGRLPEPKRRLLENLHSSDKVLPGKKVLIVDDDIRNIFAITSVLERQEMVVIPAETGQEAIERLREADGVDVVLMDVMMPGMDGYDTMNEIRKIEKLKALPIIAVTAKAMKGDREKTLQAGAWDYLAKPVDTEQMLSVLRAWLLR
jgi:CheY-like chemotaxis protein